jgi:signal transduction histidine kinase
MGVFGSLGTEGRRGRRPTIRYSFGAMVAVPVACLLVAWGLLLTGVIGGAMGDPDRPGHDHAVVVDFVSVVAFGLLIIIGAVMLMGLFARRISRDISGLEAMARRLADEQMPQLVERLRQGDQEVDADAPVQPHARTAEIAQTEAAIASLQHTAAAAAIAEARLRNGIGQVFVSLARRNQSLLQRQLRLIDALEQKASDPATLADLFPLDHLTTRMRRHAEGLIILSGAAPGRSWSEPVPVIDVIRGAVAEVEDYKRVTVLTRSEDAVAGLAAADMIHLLAELIENATLSSPSGTRVEVRAERVANGFAIEIDDRGLGIETSHLKTVNEQLAHPPDFDLANADQLGLFVVGKLAARHGVRVALRPSPYGGTTAVALMPNSIVVPANETDADTQPDLRPAIGRESGLNLGQADAPALPGRRAAPPALSMGSPPDFFSRPTADGPDGRAADLSDRTADPPASLFPDFTSPTADSPASLSPDFTTPTADTPASLFPDFRRPPGGPSGRGSDFPGTPPDLSGPARGPAGLDLSGPRGSHARPATDYSGGRVAGSPVPGLGSPAPGLDSPGDDADSPAPGLGLVPGGGDDRPGGPVPSEPGAGTYRGLPRRIRQANLNPHLKNKPAAAVGGTPADGTPPSDTRSPEEARNLVASLQSGWQRGRDTDTPDGETADAAQPRRRQDSEVPEGEETLWTSRVRPGPGSS